MRENERAWAPGRVRAFAPGRVELAGNHTDHQGGKAIAATIEDGVSMELRREEGRVARLACEGFGTVLVDLAQLGARDDETGTTASLVRGVIAGLSASGIQVGGFSGEVSSTLPAGGGLSSSAAFELALLRGLERLFGAPDALLMPALDAARIAQAAERDYFGKPCGLLDQAAIACGGATVFDFSDADAVAAAPIAFDLQGENLALVLVDSGCDHSAYTDQYAQVPCDMRAAARFFGAQRLSQVDEAVFFSRFAEVRASLGDLVALRALHYFHEMRLVEERIDALVRSDATMFLRATRASCASSAHYLQNVSCGGTADQPAMVALALADVALRGRGACRIHGGGFGGSIQAFVPKDELERFVDEVERRLGSGCCTVHQVSERGAYAEWLD